jgi:hypothetical protein
MAMCPKCFQHNKDMLATHCPDCVQYTPVGEQIAFSIVVTVVTWVVILFFLSWLILG